MRPNAELRLSAVPLAGGLVYALTKGLLKGWSAPELFSGFLFGSVLALCLGVPFLVWGDRRWPDSRLRHLLSGLLQSLVASLLVGGSLIQTSLLTVLGGLAVGVLLALVLAAIDRLGPARATRRAPILAVPLSGALTLGGVAVLLYPLDMESLPLFVLGAAIGTWLAVLVCWPMLWLVERWFTSRWRYVMGGGLSGLLLSLLFSVPGAVEHAPLASARAVSGLLQAGAACVGVGLLAGLLCSVLAWGHLRHGGLGDA